jgi:hypothetical protein
MTSFLEIPRLATRSTRPFERRFRPRRGGGVRVYIPTNTLLEGLMLDRPVEFEMAGEPFIADGSTSGAEPANAKCPGRAAGRVG